MIYFSLEFALAFLVFLLIYWQFCSKAKNIILLIFNYLVICWINPVFAICVGVYTIVIYLFGLIIYDSASKVSLAFSIIMVVFCLFVFKYFDFMKDFYDTIFIILGFGTIKSDLLFPLGLSFYSFAAITYLCHVYRQSQYKDEIFGFEEHYTPVVLRHTETSLDSKDSSYQFRMTDGKDSLALPQNDCVESHNDNPTKGLNSATSHVENNPPVMLSESETSLESTKNPQNDKSPVMLRTMPKTSLKYEISNENNISSNNQDSTFQRLNVFSMQHFLNLAIFLSFFPTFISGPIMRSDRFFAQLNGTRTFGNVNLIMVLLLFGIVKKVFIANYLEIYSTPILQNPNDYDSLSLLLSIYAYSIQLYCDFSGYVDLVGAFALCIGFVLPINFNMPYMARNIKDFWNRWHISLSTFIRDYIYIPLGGNRKGFFLTQIFVLIAFGLSGIWHGSSYNFLIWGLLHGFGVIILNICYRLGLKLEIPLLGSIITFHFVVFAWIFFYYATFDESLNYISSFINNWDKDISLDSIIYLLFAAVAFLIYPLLFNLHKKLAFILMNLNIFIKILLISFVLIIIIGFSPNGIPNFIYAGF